MADIYDKWMHESNEKDKLIQYLIADIIRMLPLVNPDVNIQSVTSDLLHKSTDELINFHLCVSRELEQTFKLDELNR